MGRLLSVLRHCRPILHWRNHLLLERNGRTLIFSHLLTYLKQWSLTVLFLSCRPAWPAHAATCAKRMLCSQSAFMCSALSVWKHAMTPGSVSAPSATLPLVPMTSTGSTLVESFHWSDGKLPLMLNTQPPSLSVIVTFRAVGASVSWSAVSSRKCG